MDDDNLITPGQVFPWVILPAMAVLIVVLVVVVTFSIINPWLMNRQTQQIHASNGYIQGIQTELSNDELAYLRLDTEIAQDGDIPSTAVPLRSQQKALLDQMRIDAGKIPAIDLPPNVSSLLATR